MYEFLDRRYALALYNTCVEAGNVELVLEDLKEIVDEMKNNEGLIKIIRNPQINKYNKKRIFKELFKGSIEDELLSFLLLLIEKGRILYLKEKYTQFRLIYLEHNNTVIAKIKSVIPLDENQREAIKQKLEKRYEKTIILEEQIDESLLGGIQLTVGNEVITLVKDTSLVYILGASDILKAAKSVSNTYSTFTPYIIVALVYLAIIAVLTKLLSGVEKRYNYYR